MSECITVIGLGYVGLPVALAFARHFPTTVGFDTNVEKIKALRQGIYSPVLDCVRPGRVLMDVKSVLDPATISNIT